MKAPLIWLLLVLTMVSGGACEPARNPKPAFKGMELYSFKQKQDWAFALLPGTNRSKNWPEIQEAAIDLVELESRLSRLAVGELVSWTHHCPSARLAYPPKDITSRIQAHCNSLEIELFLPAAKNK